MSELYADVPGQAAAVAALRAAARRPVHAYLFVGAPGTGKRDAARSFAASLLCPNGGDGTCDVCQRVLAEVHPDLVVVERQGAFILVDAALEVVRLAARSPVEGDRKVLILEDLHLVREAGPALLKTIEEPPESTVFVILAEYVPPELVTIASRCVQVEFAVLSPADVAAALEAEGVAGDRAVALASASGGRLDRARLLAADPEFEARRDGWRTVPARLDGSGATVAQVADELVGLLEASVVPIRARQEAEMAALEERNVRAVAVSGGRGGGKGRAGAGGRAGRAGMTTGVKELEERHRRELRRQRTDELRAGLAALAGVYRDRLMDGGEGRRIGLAAVALIDQVAEDLEYNPGELLLLQAVLVRLDRLQGAGLARA